MPTCNLCNLVNVGDLRAHVRRRHPGIVPPPADTDRWPTPLAPQKKEHNMTMSSTYRENPGLAYARKQGWTPPGGGDDRPPPTGNPATAGWRYANAYSAWLRHGDERMNDHDKALLVSVLNWEAERRDLGIATGAQGGFSVAPGFVGKVTTATKRASAMMRACRIIPTTTGNPLSWPTTDDTGVAGALLAEAAVMTAADIVFGTKALSSYVISSKRVNASFQLLQDTGVDFETWLAGVLGSRIGRGLNPLLTNGTGAGLQPVGIVPNVAVGKQGLVGQTVTIIYDDLIDLIHSVDASYRVGPEELLPEEPPPSGHLGWMLSDTTLKVCRKIRDAQQRPIVMDGTPTTMLGYRCSINNDMPNPGASNKTIIFGDFFRGYAVRAVRDLIIVRSEELLGDKLQVAFLGFWRGDGVPDDSAALRAYQHSAT